MNKFPVVYALIPFAEACGKGWTPHGRYDIYLPYYYIIQKMFLIGIDTEYTNRGTVKRLYHVVSPIEEVKGSVPLVFYRPERVDECNYEVVDSIYLNLEDAKKAKEEINNSIDKSPFYMYDPRLSVGNERYELLERTYLDMLSDLEVGFSKEDNYKYDKDERYYIDESGVRKRVKPGEYDIYI